MKTFDPYKLFFTVDGESYAITVEALDDFRAAFGNSLSPEEIIGRLKRRFPGEKDFNTSHVERYLE